MLNEAGLEDEVRSGIWAECALNATFSSNVLLTNGRSKSPQDLMFGKKPHCANNLGYDKGKYSRKVEGLRQCMHVC